MRFKAVFEVLPDFKVTPYGDIKVETINTNVTDEEVETSLKNLRDQQATYTAVEEDRPLADGDFAVASFKGTPKDAESDAKPVEVDEIMVEIGGENTIPEFTENLRGAKANEQRTF